MKDSFNGNFHWYYRRTTNERQWIIITVILFVISLGLFIAFMITLNKSAKKHEETVCLTPGCVHAASVILEQIDTSVDPCDDFYEFACGGRLKKMVIPPDKTEVGIFSEISDSVRDQLKALNDEPLKPGASKPYRYIRKVYDACMNVTAIEEDGLETFMSYLKELGGWPILEGKKWNERRFDWKELMYKLRRLGVPGVYFITVDVNADDKNSSRRIIGLDETSLGFSRELLVKGLNETTVKVYYDFMVAMTVIFGADEEVAKKEMMDVLEFKIKLANICVPIEETRNISNFYHPMTVEELQRQYPIMDWLEYLNNIYGIEGDKITLEDDVNVRVPKYLNQLNELLNKTSKRIQANFIITSLTQRFISFLTEELRQMELEHTSKISGLEELPARWKECTSIASRSIDLAVSSLYVQKYFKDDTKSKVQEIVSDVRKQFRKMLEEVDWIDKNTKANAIDKLDSMAEHIGYPDELLDEKKIEKYYSNLELEGDNYLNMMQNIMLFETNIYYKKLRKPVNKTDWIEHSMPTFVNAFYSGSENSIQFPAGILQGLFFNKDRPKYLNYGAIGYVVGHEITHGFDDEGRQIDKDGNLENWWSEETQEAFIKKTQCIIDEYASYKIPRLNLTLNGITTQGENIADFGGIKEAYLAYNGWVERNEPELPLPGLPYTSNQLFWISAAHTWCSKQKDEDLRLTVVSGSHAPDNFRVIGPFSNSEYFARDFECPEGSPMNPVNKCSVW